MNFVTSRYLAFSESFEEKDKFKRIIYSTRTSLTALIDENIFQKILKNDFSNIDDKLLNSLFSMEIIIPENENEFNEIMIQNSSMVDNIHHLDLTIQPTANCQLGCHYCAQKHSKNNMESDVYDKTLERIKSKLESSKFKNLFVNWYGGEPLNALSQLKKMSTEIINLCKINNVEYHSSIITNGLSLKPNIFKELYLNHKIWNYQITLDGTAKHHDTRRITKKGENTFDIIFNNIINIINLDYYQEEIKDPILIRINIDKTNLDSIKPLIDLFAENNAQGKIQFSFAPIVDWGDKKYGTIDGFTKRDFADIEIDLMLYAHQKGFLINTSLTPKREYMPCMVVAKDSEVFDAFGNVYPCYEFTYTPAYNDDKHKIGNLLNESFVPNELATTRNWYNDIKKEGFSTCNKCELLPVCGGGCVKNWYNDETGCPSFKFNFSDRLLIDYLNKNNALVI
ncbi:MULTISPECIES: radical SAM/SPASM domain-containing protein [unclassified Empedobacter]|uniref:radical SAM/SPASM domain-containing protein n=1 Tax=unclassified Empedobacter TaxID=2643773 RepID=UPI0025C19694|nr:MULTISPECIES: radical SAM protein [unclassified Empedobacter]